MTEPRPRRTPATVVLTACTTVLTVALALALSAPAAAAGPVARPGAAITISDGLQDRRCTLGFPARDARGLRLAVTAGHCASGLHQKVYLGNRISIGIVIAWQPDELPNRNYGFTVIRLYDNVAQSPVINNATAAQYSDRANVGDLVCMYGVKSGRSCDTIEYVSDALLGTSDIADHGDSGAPVIRVTDGALVGILIAGNRHNNPEVSRGFIEPIGRITAMVSRLPGFSGFGPIVTDPR